MILTIQSYLSPRRSGSETEALLMKRNERIVNTLITLQYNFGANFDYALLVRRIEVNKIVGYARL